MTGSFTDDQVGKPVYTRRDRYLGTVERVERGELYVRVGEEPDRDALDTLSWDEHVSQAVHHLPDQYVSSVSEDAIEIRA